MAKHGISATCWLYKQRVAATEETSGNVNGKNTTPRMQWYCGTICKLVAKGFSKCTCVRISKRR